MDVMDDNPALSGTDIKDPKQDFDRGTGARPIVTFSFTDRGKKRLENDHKVARRGQEPSCSRGPSDARSTSPRLDNELITVPFIDFVARTRTASGRPARDRGRLRDQVAQDLAELLAIGALPVKLEQISHSQVSASLAVARRGAARGRLALPIAVVLFLLTFYRMPGAIAIAALGVYGLYLFALMKLVPITLTLPGIAGLILTVGVAADANIVIFERVKEEVRAGHLCPRPRHGLQEGPLLDHRRERRHAAGRVHPVHPRDRGRQGLRVHARHRHDRLAVHRRARDPGDLLSLRGTKLLAAAPRSAPATEAPVHLRLHGRVEVVLLDVRRDPAGRRAGDRRQGPQLRHRLRVGRAVSRPRSADRRREQVRDASGRPGSTTPRSSASTTPSSARTSSRSRPRSPAGRVAVESALDDEFGLTEQVTGEEVGPTFGESVANSALIAIIASLLVISLYIALRFEWKYAVPVLIALMHDLLITAGVYSLIGREVTTSTVAALLTILGYSLYDTIIVFDRIRENVPRMPRAAFSQIVNRSMAEVIVRSLATGFCTALLVLSLLLFGGETLKDFAFALLVGIVSGAYSSIFIAAPVLTHWKEREPVYAPAAPAIIRELGAVPAYAVRSGARRPTWSRPSARGSQRRRPAGSEQRSREEFDEMVRDLDVEEDRQPPAPARPPAARPASPRPRQRRPRGLRPRSRRRHAGPEPDGQPPRQAQAQQARATGSTGGRADGRARLGDDGHRPVALHDLLPRPLLGRDRRRVPRRADRLRLVGLAVNGFAVPRRRHRVLATLEAIPGSLLGIASVYFSASAWPTDAN